MLVLSEHEQERVIFWTIIGICPGVVCLGVPKFAVVSLLCKLMNPSKYHRWFMWSMATVSVLSLFAVTGTLLGQCQPMASQWNFDINGECIDKKPLVAFSIYASGKSGGFGVESCYSRF